MDDVGEYFSAIFDARTKAQIGTVDWVADYPAASGFFAAVLTCGPRSANPAQFCDPRIDRRITRAVTAGAADTDGARGLWERIDRQTVDQAPWLPLVNPKVVDVLSQRVGNYQYSPRGLGVLLDQLWVQ